MPMVYVGLYLNREAIDQSTIDPGTSQRPPGRREIDQSTIGPGGSPH